VRGFEGGREASRQLIAISHNCLSLSQYTKMTIHVFADLNNLAATLNQADIIRSEDVFFDFVGGFESVGEMSNFIHVTSGADQKIKSIPSCQFAYNADLTKMYAAMPQCDNIVLGGSSEHLYAGMLPDLDVSPEKVVLLQAPEIKRYYEPLFSRVRLSMSDLMDKKPDSGKKYAYAQVAAAEAILPPFQLTRKISSPPRPPASITPQRLVEPELGMPPRTVRADERCLVIGEKSKSTGLQHVLSEPSQMLQDGLRVFS
jgi:hypothetical protein